MALIWAAGIIWFALQVAAPEQSSTGKTDHAQATDVTGAPVRDEDVKKVEGILKNL